jgi:hypothetical protein
MCGKPLAFRPFSEKVVGENRFKRFSSDMAPDHRAEAGANEKGFHARKD